MVLIESRRDYELYVKQEISMLPISNKYKKIVSKTVMAGFDTGYKLRTDGKVTLVSS